MESRSRLTMGQEYCAEVVGSKQMAGKASESAPWMAQFLKMNFSEMEKEVRY